MATIEVHCADCVRILGEPYREVHEWLDEFAKKFPPEVHGAYHRRFRHNIKGVQFIAKKWGGVSDIAARIHIDRDDGVEFGGRSSLCVGV